MPKASFLFWRLLSAVASMIFLAYQAGPAGAQVFEETRQACAPEAMRLCRDVIPDIPKITACMEAKFAEINLECRMAMIREKYGRRGQWRKAHASSGS
jgi:predicted RNA polymerase sigma factor